MGFGRITSIIAVDNIPARGLGGGEWATPGPSGQMPGAGVPLHVPFTWQGGILSCNMAWDMGHVTYDMGHVTWDMGHVTSHWMTCYDGALPCLTITSGEILIISRPWLQNITECSIKSTDAKCLMFIVAIVTRIVFNTLIVTPLLCNAVSHHQALHYSAHHLSLIFLYKQQHSHFIIILICHSLHFNWSICWHRHTLQQVD